MKSASSIEYTVGEAMPGTKWVVRGKLGQGGMGLVLDVVKARLIQGAMKVLLPPFAEMPEFAAKFLDEVKVTARLQHPNIVQVLDFDRLSDGTPFMVMERLRGRTLRAALRETRQRGKAWTPANTYAVAAQAAEGLYRAHSHEPSIVHRDVKPENLFLHRTEASFESVVKVMDFGVAAVVGERDRQNIGTPRYMAPEQVTGGELSPQTDQYALALVIYEMLTGRLPWDVNARDAKALAEVHRHAPPAPTARFCPWLPARMDAAILKALSKNPGARHDTLHGLIFELRGLQWISDRPAATADVHTTDPMVGTLADGGVAVREEEATFDRMSPNGPSLGLTGLTGPSEVSVAFSEALQRRPGPSGPVSEEDAAATREHTSSSRRTTRLGSDAVAPVPPPGAADDGPPAQQAVETPMTGASGPRESGNTGAFSHRGLRAAVVALVGSGGVLAAWAAVGGMHSSRRAEPPEATPIESQAHGAGLSAPEPAVEPNRPAMEAAQTPGAIVDLLVPAASLAPTTQAVVSRPPGARPDGGARPPAARKAAAIPAPAALRGLPAKTAVPDDGRDELYVPGGR